MPSACHRSAWAWDEKSGIISPLFVSSLQYIANDSMSWDLHHASAMPYVVLVQRACSAVVTTDRLQMQRRIVVIQSVLWHWFQDLTRIARAVLVVPSIETFCSILSS